MNTRIISGMLFCGKPISSKIKKNQLQAGIMVISFVACSFSLGFDLPSDCSSHNLNVGVKSKRSRFLDSPINGSVRGCKGKDHKAGNQQTLCGYC